MDRHFGKKCHFDSTLLRNNPNIFVPLNRPYALMSRLHNNDAMLGVKTCRAARTCCAGERWRSQPLSQCAGPGRPGSMACRGWPGGFMLGDGARDSASFDPQCAGAPFCDVICIRSILKNLILALSFWFCCCCFASAEDDGRWGRHQRAHGGASEETSPRPQPLAQEDEGGVASESTADLPRSPGGAAQAAVTSARSEESAERSG